MSKGRQDAGPEWCKICAQVREQFLEVCPLSNRRFDNTPGTFRRSQIMQRCGISLANIRRLVDDQLPGTPDTVIRLAKFLGYQITLERVAPRPIAPIASPSEAYKFGIRSPKNRSRRRRRRA